MTADKDEIERGSGNVFADLRLPDAEAHLLKAQLVTRIDDVVRRRGLKQVEAAKLLGLHGAPAAPANGAGLKSSGSPPPSHRRSWLVALDIDPILVLARLDEIVGRLPAEPELGIGPARLLKPDGHLRRNRRAAVQYAREMCGGRLPTPSPPR